MMRKPDKAQRKLTADYLEKFSLALATAIAAKIFFSEDGITTMTIFAAVIMITSFFASYLFMARRIRTIRR